ncbi:pyridoxamine 5'-phosphate oxidase family protein [Streptomyces sp. NPDC056112]|uniref:pyridoxamine 5'-phosphate oxidase family protein n=1 Tax=unclassified Streptomyces TaxID=2593676 RepID=UPI001CD4D79E|nr:MULTISPECIES: pyridoxamine 5'-phosphate oxidase family protein [unclassified Streptomyces]
MHAQLGDRLVVESPVTGDVRRDGEIVGLHHEDGTPPYDVRWSDTGEITLVFPGPDAHVRHPGEDEETTAGGQAPAEPSGAGPGRPGDFGRRLAAARRKRGLSLEETAGRARMSPQYLAYLEQRPSAPGMGTVVRLADALDTTLITLSGGDQDLPPGQGQALLHPRLTDLGPDECRALLSTHGVGRVALTGPDGPAVLPVNYDVVDDSLVFRTEPDAAPAAAVGHEVAFEVDQVDETMSQGWSVLAVGRAEAVTDAEAVRRLEQRVHSDPWAGGPRTLWVRIRPARLTGRRITPADG